MRKLRPVVRSYFQPHVRRLGLEVLEDRNLLAITVNTLVDELDGSIVDGDISLRDAIAAATSGETINFSVTGTISLSLGQLTVNKDLAIIGPGANLLTIDQDTVGSRVFNITRPTSTSMATSMAGIFFGGKGVMAHPPLRKARAMPTAMPWSMASILRYGRTSTAGGRIRRQR